MSNTSADKRFKAGDKVRCVEGCEDWGLHPGSTYTVKDECGGLLVLDEDVGREWLPDRFVLADQFTDGREKFKAGDRVRTKYDEGTATVTSVSTDPAEVYPVAVRFDDVSEDNYRVQSLTLAESPAPTPTPTVSPYETLGAEIGRLVAEKQVAYQDSFGKSGAILRVLYPNGVKPEQYDDMLTLTRMIDKMFRASGENKSAFGESPYKDLAGYSLLAAVRDMKVGS